MKVGIIGAGTMGSGIAQAFAMTDGYEVCLCDIKQEFADGGKAKILKNLNFLVSKLHTHLSLQMRVQYRNPLFLHR